MSGQATQTNQDKVGAIAHLDLAEDESAQLIVGAFRISINRNDVGISIDVYPDIEQPDEPLASLQVWDDDLEESRMSR